MEGWPPKVALIQVHVRIDSGAVFRAPNPGEWAGYLGKKHLVIVPEVIFTIIVDQEGENDHAIAFLIPGQTGRRRVIARPTPVAWRSQQ